MSALRKTELTQLQTVPCNRALLNNLEIALQFDPWGFAMRGQTAGGPIPSRVRPVNLREHFAHLLGLYYWGLTEHDLELRISRALGLDILAVWQLVEIGKWPQRFRLEYDKVNKSKNKADMYKARVAVTCERIDHFVLTGE
jgi:hypothetical protein